MTFDTFKSNILDSLGAYYGDDYTLSIRTIPKNNQISLDGLTIQEKGCNISPTIYLNSYYEEFKRGASFYSILEKIKNLYAINRPSENIDIRFFSDFELVQDRICMKLVHYEKNRELLNEIPHIRFLDLAVVFYYLLNLIPGENATILIYNNHMEHWKTNTDILYQYAKENTSRLLPYYFDDIFTILNDIEHPDEYPGKPDNPLYVLTNSEKLFGAATILYPELLSSIAKRLNRDLIIFPSSVHEVLILPISDSDNLEKYEAVINDINKSHLLPEEVLSDHAYYYSRKSRSIT